MTVSAQGIIFLCGFGGSAAVEIVMLHQLMQDGGELPARYFKPAFWIVRTLLAVVGGGLALAYDIDKPLLAANIGAATPLIIKAFSEGIRSPATSNQTAPPHSGLLSTVTAETAIGKNNVERRSKNP